MLLSLLRFLFTRSDDFPSTEIPTMSNTAQNDYDAAQAAAQTVTTDTATIAADQAKLDADKATLATDAAAQASADKQLATDLAAGPGFILNLDNSITLLSASSTDPRGWSSMVVQPLANLSSVTPPPPPAPAPVDPPAPAPVDPSTPAAS